jgi:uncharacterized protein
MTALKWILIVFLSGYGGLAALLYVVQRGMMYFPETERVAPAQAGLPEAQEAMLDTEDGEHLVAWLRPPRDAHPVILYFHGNGGNLSHRAPRFRALTADGNGLLALSYRGFGGSTGRPSEHGLIADARAAYGEAVRRYGPDRLILWGESLGTGVAVALAAERKVKALVLEAPFTSTLDLASRAYPMFPVSWLMKDQFRSDLRVARVDVPVLVLHGARDGTIPIAYGARLFSLIKGPKKFVRFADGDHNDLDNYGATDVALRFIAALR